MLSKLNQVIILGKKNEILKEIFNLDFDHFKNQFQKKDFQKIRLWYKDHKKEILSAQNFSPFWKKNVLILKKHSVYNPLGLLRILDELGYEKSRQVFVPGEYAHRGEIIDIFSLNLAKPVRLEFLGHEIERIYFIERPIEIKDERFGMNIEFQKNALLNLALGDYIVHLDHGIGRFQGILNKDAKKYYELEYAGRDILLVPLGLERKLSPYIGFVEPKIHRLGGALWHHTKKKVKEDALKFAKELLVLYAKRELASRLPYRADDEMQKQLEADFEFELTSDQKRTLLEIKKDLTKNHRPMDRLICGDVGFGKTEMALRAAFKAAASGKQVALISPTTILADQHYHTFVSRLKNFPIEVSLLSRIISKKNQLKILRDIKEGKIDIIIGTHRLLSKDVVFKNLGLLIIDEEQRFGVRQKEKLKKARANIDILSLSATPIPRTLHMALSQLKDISVILTPPLNKKPIETLILSFRKQTIKKAILNEINRKGQVYYLHNRIDTIFSVTERLKKLLPKSISINFIHGRMKEKNIIKTIHDFRAKRFDVLIATTIIENGLDFKNVNTLIVEDSTKLGLAQAHQIRGRIGRANQKAFAYFFYSPHRLNPIAKERLNALKKFSYLGAGYQIASKDLEIRGAGNILGKEQSGAINKVGLNLYYQILNQAIAEIQRVNS